MTGNPRPRPRTVACRFLLTLVSVLPLIVVPLPVGAQNAQGTVLGHVTDPTGSAVAGARVTLLNNGAGIRLEDKSNGAGDYVFVNVQPGHYTLNIETPGFKTAEAAGLIV